MQYKQICEGVFRDRPNRFIAHVEIGGKTETVHVKNTGRCRELLEEGNTVYLEKSSNPNRKTAYDLIAVMKKRQGKPDLLVNMDSQIPNDVVEEWLKAGNLFGLGAEIFREKTFGDSRFDFFVRAGNRRIFLEVKGCTLEQDGVARFPDAPTLRGTKHLRELLRAKEEGYEAYLLIVLQMKECTVFSPNDATDPEFGETLRQVVSAGVNVLALDCKVTPDTLTIDREIPIQL